jgi:hypothetical protein
LERERRQYRLRIGIPLLTLRFVTKKLFRALSPQKTLFPTLEAPSTYLSPTTACKYEIQMIDCMLH